MIALGDQDDQERDWQGDQQGCQDVDWDAQGLFDFVDLQTVVLGVDQVGLRTGIALTDGDGEVDVLRTARNSFEVDGHDWLGAGQDLQQLELRHAVVADFLFDNALKYGIFCDGNLNQQVACLLHSLREHVNDLDVDCEELWRSQRAGRWSGELKPGRRGANIVTEQCRVSREWTRAAETSAQTEVTNVVVGDLEEQSTTSNSRLVGAEFDVAQVHASCHVLTQGISATTTSRVVEEARVCYRGLWQCVLIDGSAVKDGSVGLKLYIDQIGFALIWEVHRATAG